MKKKKFQWMHRETDFGQKENGLFIDDELFDWEVDESSIRKVMETGDPDLIKAAQEDIKKHYIESLSEFIGRRITYADIDKAEKTGWI